MQCKAEAHAHSLHIRTGQRFCIQFIENRIPGDRVEDRNLRNIDAVVLDSDLRGPFSTVKIFTGGTISLAFITEPNVD
jgi:hypothetical protein